MTAQDWTARFSDLGGLEPGLRRKLVDASRVLSVPKDTVVFGPGKAAENLLLVLKGTVRVQQVTEGGREIVLYRVHAGESCILTTACLLADETYSAEGVTESDVEAVAIPRSVFDDLLARSRPFRDFVFRAYSRRLTEMFLMVEEIAYGRTDIRLAQRLLDLSEAQGGTIRITQAQLAAELGTAREVVTRQLGEFQRRGWVELSRGQVGITDAPALQAHTQRV